MYARSRDHQVSLAGNLGGIHSPDFTAIGLDPHTLQFQASSRPRQNPAARDRQWQVMWWWPAAVLAPAAPTYGDRSK